MMAKDLETTSIRRRSAASASDQRQIDIIPMAVANWDEGSISSWYYRVVIVC